MAEQETGTLYAELDGPCTPQKARKRLLGEPLRRALLRLGLRLDTNGGGKHHRVTVLPAQACLLNSLPHAAAE
uniref:Uncharacterized protein n=1 Tax=Sphaerodactylus townsendi TaxID=933632 RepID=A0ACB8F340_9SAUR